MRLVLVLWLISSGASSRHGHHHQQRETKADGKRKRYELGLASKDVGGPCDRRCVLGRKGKRMKLRDAKAEGAQSGRRPSDVIKATGVVQLGDATARYFNLLPGDASVPPGIYLVGREGASHERFNASRARVAGSQFRTSVFFAPIIGFDADGGVKNTVAFQRTGIVVDDWRITHNLATTTANGTILGIGGARCVRNIHGKIMTLRAPDLAAILNGRWLRSKTSVTSLDGNVATSGCVDARATDGVCRFDGKHSVVAGTRGVLLYSRSNLRPRGGRFVQVATASSLAAMTDATVPWKPYHLIDFLGRPDVNRSDFNVYYATINPNPVDPASFVGLFAVADKSFGYVGLAISCDGRHFGHLHTLITAPHVREGRPYDMPVDGFLQLDNGRLFAFVQRNVPNVLPFADSDAPSLIAVHELHPPALLTWTQNAIRALSSCPTPVRGEEARGASDK